MSENGTILQIDVDGEIQKIVRQLNDLPTQLKAPTVLARAMNLTANEIKRKIGKQARKKYAITDDRILKDKSKGAMYLEKATGADPAAVLISKGTMMEVMAYTTRRNDSATAAMLKVLNESNLTALEVDGRKAFEATFTNKDGSTHTAIVQRRTKDRLPVKKLLAPAVPHLYGKSYEEAELDYYGILQKHIQQQVEKVLAQRS